MITRIRRQARLVLFAVGAFGILSLAGCGPKRVPASGSVDLDGKPLEGGILYFNPDTSKGNNARVSCSSPVKNGKFELQTAGVERSDSGPGVPLGWYKVSVRVNTPGEPPIFPGPVIANIDPVYLDPEKTPVSIEVVENPAPGQYDIKLKKK
jgi:hypothetical protein